MLFYVRLDNFLQLSGYCLKTRNYAFLPEAGKLSDEALLRFGGHVAWKFPRFAAECIR